MAGLHLQDATLERISAGVHACSQVRHPASCRAGQLSTRLYLIEQIYKGCTGHPLRPVKKNVGKKRFSHGVAIRICCQLTVSEIPCRQLLIGQPIMRRDLTGYVSEELVQVIPYTMGVDVLGMPP